MLPVCILGLRSKVRLSSIIDDDWEDGTPRFFTDAGIVLSLASKPTVFRKIGREP